MSERPNNLELVVDNTQETAKAESAESGFGSVALEIHKAVDSLEETLESFRSISVGGKMIEAANDNELQLAGVDRLIEAVDGLREKLEHDRHQSLALAMVAQRLEALRTRYAIDADLANMAESNPGAAKVAESVAHIEDKLATLSLNSAANGAPTEEVEEHREAA